jgi:hypothetical protein
MTCGSGFFLSPNVTALSTGNTNVNLTVLLVNGGSVPQHLTCTATVYSGKAPSTVQFPAVVNPSCPAGAIARNRTTCKAIVTPNVNPCGLGFWYSNSTGMCQPSPSFCPVGYTQVSNIQYQCVLQSACASGYTFELNSAGAPVCVK